MYYNFDMGRAFLVVASVALIIGVAIGAFIVYLVR